MGLEIYNVATRQLIVRIEDESVTYIAPNFTPLKRIPIEACFSALIPGEKEKIFGNVKFITPDHDLYPKAVEMYCRAQLLSHPETWTDKPLS